MANNISVTEGSGKTVATEDISSAQYQKIKVVDGTAAGTTGLKVNSDGSINASVYGLITQTGTVVTSIVGIPSVSGTLNIASVSGAINLYAQPASFVLGVTSIITGTTAASILGAPGASLRNFITHITVTNAAAAGAIVDIKDSGANVLYSGYAAASGGGFAASFPIPIRQTNTNASVDVVSRSQASIIAAASGFVAP